MTKRASAVRLSEAEQSEPAAAWMPTRELQPWDRNPRKNDFNVVRVAESIKRFGFSAPIVARKQDLKIIAGHTRWKAAQMLGLAQVPVRLLELDEREAELLALADNRLAELSPWDEAQLQELLAEFGPEDAALAGWSSDDLEKLAETLPGEPQGELEEDEPPELPIDPVTRLGDVWALGRHRLICGDGQLVEGRWGMVVTDPPYGISVVKKGMVGADFGVAKKGRYVPIAGDDSTPDVRWLLDRADVLIIWGGNYFANQLPPTGGWLVWDKRDDSGIENTFADCELAWASRTGAARIHRQLWNGMIRAGERGKRVHPTQKPVALMGWCVGFGEGEVFDPYAGSGSTLIACEQLKRTCTAVELSPAYCDVIVQRWEALTGERATRG